MKYSSAKLMSISQIKNDNKEYSGDDCQLKSIR